MSTCGLPRRRTLRMGVGALVACCGFPLASASSTQQRRILCGFSAGGIADRLCRVFAEEAGKLTGETCVVQNLPGAGGLLATREASRSEPDGTTLLLGPAGIFRTRGGLSESTFDPLKQLSALVLVGAMPLGVFVRSVHPARSVQQLVQLSHLSGEPLLYATTGHGSSSHVMGEYLARVTRTLATHIPYSGSAQVANALHAGHVPSAILDPMTLEALVRQGHVRCLGVSSPKPHRRLPGVPSLVEQGLAEQNFSSWQGFFLPSATDEPTRHRLRSLFASLLETQTVRRAMSEGYIEGDLLWAEQAQRFVSQDSAQFQRLMADLGIRLA